MKRGLLAELLRDCVEGQAMGHVGVEDWIEEPKAERDQGSPDLSCFPDFLYAGLRDGHVCGFH
jgi:hypothetical protein